MVLGLVTAVVLAHGSVIKAIAMIMIGLLLGLIGTDVNSGATRYTFGVSVLWDGLDFLPMVIGMFGVVEIIRNLEQPDVASHGDLGAVPRPVAEHEGFHRILAGGDPRHVARRRFSAFCPAAASCWRRSRPIRWRRRSPRIRRASARARSKASPVRNPPTTPRRRPRSFRCSPSACRRTPIMALMMGAMMIQGIQPGSAVMTSRPDLFWGMVASMWIGNLMLVIINLPMIGIWVKLLSLPYRFLYPAILLFCVIGVYSTNNNAVLMVFTAGFALFGYILVRFGCEPAPMILGFILGPLMEENLRRSLVLSRGDPMIFVQRPISAILLVLTAVRRRADRPAGVPQDPRGSVRGISGCQDRQFCQIRT